MNSKNKTAIAQMKFSLLKARLSGPGGNTTGADGLTLKQAAETSNVDVATILMDPLDFYQVWDNTISWLWYSLNRKIKYYGPLSLPPFCENLETRNFTSQPSERGITVSSGDVQVAFDAFLVALAELDYDTIASKYLWAAMCRRNWSRLSDADANQNDPVADRSWMWQYCSEYGMSSLFGFITPSTSPNWCRRHELRFLSTWRPREPAIHRDCLSFPLTLPIPVQPIFSIPKPPSPESERSICEQVWRMEYEPFQRFLD